MRTSFHHQSEAQPPNGPLTAATSPDTPSMPRKRPTADLRPHVAKGHNRTHAPQQKSVSR
jgi:hypothetical protein